MSAIRLTKNEQRNQQRSLLQLRRYLPTLQLKKSLLQFEVSSSHLEISSLRQFFLEKQTEVAEFSPFLLEKVSCDLSSFIDVQCVNKHYENVAGVEVPVFESISFQPVSYFLVDAPVWTESAMILLKELVSFRERLAVAQEKKRFLEKELREVSIRVNLFEKILIPRCVENLKKIHIFLGDQQLASVAQAKVAKAKILKKKLGSLPHNYDC